MKKIFIYPLCMPSFWEKLAIFYYELVQYLESGVGILKALSAIKNSTRWRWLRGIVDELAVQISRGASFSEAFEQASRWNSKIDLSLIKAGEVSGRLPQMLNYLSNFYRMRATLVKKIGHSLLYPIVILIISSLIFPISQFQALILEGAWTAFLLGKLKLFLNMCLIIGGVILILNQPPTNYMRRLMERLFFIIPPLKKFILANGIVRLSMSLQALLEAGLTLPNAWQLAAESCGVAVLQSKLTKPIQLMKSGVPAYEALKELNLLPIQFLEIYETGEISGHLDEALAYIIRMYSEEVNRYSELLGTWTGRVVYFVLLIFGAIQVLNFWLGYLRFISTY